MFSGEARRVTPEQDAAYLAAARSGDTVQAQKLVDEAAKAAGYTVGPVFHGTQKEFTEFNPKYAGSVTAGPGTKEAWWFSEDLSHAQERGGRVLETYLNPGKVLSIPELTDTYDAGAIAAKARKQGYDSVFFERLDDSEMDSNGRPTWALLLKDNTSARIKSADPITRDDQGNVIPLSERFNPAAEDIRFSGEAKPGSRNVPLDPQKAIQIEDADHARRLWEAGYTLYGVQYDGFEEVPARITSRKQLEQFDPENMAAMAPRTQESRLSGESKPILPQEPGFYSKLERVIESEMKSESMPAAQLKAILRNRGVKAEELKWTRVDDKIDSVASENGGKVPKEQLLRVLKETRPQFKIEGPSAEKIQYVVSDESGHSIVLDTLEKAESVQQDWADELTNRILNAAQYLVEETGEGTFKVVTNAGDPPRIRDARGNLLLAPHKEYASESDADTALREAIQEHSSSLIKLERQRSNYEPDFELWTIPGGKNYREIAFAGPDIQKWSGASKHDFEALGTSEAVGNIRRIAHMRVNDRTDSQGRPGLFIEEIQSDRHQAGRSKGYREEGPQLFQYPDGEWGLKGWKLKFVTKESALDHWRTYPESNPAVPDAPFRKDWAIQMFKRALKDAVDDGKSWIGWTDGETQAERFRLSKRVKSLEYYPETQELYAYDYSGDDIFGGNAQRGKKVAPEDLEEMIGKEAAKQLLAEPLDPTDKAHRLETSSLKLGGEGMKKFYDSILPIEVEKYVKKWNAKVEQADMPYVPKNGEEGVKGVASIWKVDISPEMARSVSVEGQERFSGEARPVTLEEEARKLDALGNKSAPQANPQALPYPQNPNPDSIALPARWGLVNRNIAGMPRSHSEVKGIVERQVARLQKVVRENPEFAKESARFYLDMGESSMLMADAAFPASYGKEKWRSAELMLRFLALGSPRTGVSANATKSAYSASAAASDFPAGLRVGFGSQQTGAKNTFQAWKKGLAFDMHGEGVDNKVRNFYINGLAELLDLARKEGNPEAVDYLMNSAAAGLEMIKPGEKVSPEQHSEVQRLLDGMATVDMWDMAAKGYAWPGWISNKKARPGEGKTPWVWTEDKYAAKSTLGSPTWKKIASELSKKKRVVTTPADLRYQEARALRIEGNKDWDATTWAERIQKPFGPETELTTFTNVSEEGLSPGGAGPLYDAQQSIDGLIADEINRQGMAPLFGKDKLLARNAQEILWALERLDNPIEANNELALFGNTFKAFSREINRIRTDEYGPVKDRPKPDERGAVVLKAMEAAYAALANQDLPIEVVSAGTTPEAKVVQSAIQRLRDSGVPNPEVVVTQSVADGLHEFLTEAADRHGIDVTVDRVAVGNGGYTENGVPSVNPNLVLRLRGDPVETRNLLEILSRAMDQDGGNIIRRPTITELNSPMAKFNTVVTFETKGMTPDQKTAFFMDLNGLKDADGNSFFTGFTETADGMAIGDQFYGGDMLSQVKTKRLEILRTMRKHGVPNFWADSVVIETVSRNHPEPEGLREQPFAKEVMSEIRRRLESAGGPASEFPQTLNEESRALRQLESGKSADFSGTTALMRYFVAARSAIDAAMIRGTVDPGKGEQLKQALTEVEKLRTPEIEAQVAEKAQERAKAKALEARRKARLKALKEKRNAPRQAAGGEQSSSQAAPATQ